MEIRPIFEVCTKEKGYEGGGRLHKPWRRQADAEQQLKAMLEEILASAWEQRQKESSRIGV